jgi:AraC-like DNA-binding protein
MLLSTSANQGNHLPLRESLSNFPIISTNQVEAAECAISRTLSDVKILKVNRNEPFQLRMNGHKFGNASLIFNRFNSGTEIKTGRPLSSVLIILGNEKPSTFKFDSTSVTVSQNRAVCVMPGDNMEIERTDGSEIIVLKIELSDLMDHLENLTYKHQRGQLYFDRNIDLTAPDGAMLARAVRYVSSELNHNSAYSHKQSLQTNLENLLQSAILCLPNKHRHQLTEDRQYHVDPSCVLRAEEYMRAHLGEAISIKDLLIVSPCSRNALFAAFKNLREYTPMEFLKEQRLLRAYKKLTNSPPNGSVSYIATACGFNDLSRFARFYRNRFGEYPSVTLQTIC